jgi:hypothetical protein
MKNFPGLAILACVLLAAGPASAGNYFDFTGTAGNPYTTSDGITATAYAFEATGTAYTGSGATLVASTYTNLYGPTSTGNNAPTVGEYSGDGFGICEGLNQNSNGNDCSSPNHQVNNGPNNVTSAAAACSSTNNCNFEFMLIQFNSAVNLSQIQLGNWGTTGANSDPFVSTFWTSSSAASLATVESGLENTSVSGVTGTDGFGTETAGACTGSGSTSNNIGGGGNNNGSYVDNCAVNGNGLTTLNANNVTYLLFGASVAPGQAGQDFFKIQDISFTPTATPEPATFGLIGISLAGLGLLSRKRRGK